MGVRSEDRTRAKLRGQVRQTALCSLLTSPTYHTPIRRSGDNPFGGRKKPSNPPPATAPPRQEQHHRSQGGVGGVADYHGEGLRPKKSNVSPKRMDGPPVGQYLQDSVTSAKRDTTRKGKGDGGHGGGRAPQRGKTAPPGGGSKEPPTGDAGGRWTCTHCGSSNADGLPYCEACARYRVRGAVGKGEERAVVTNDFSWNAATVKAGTRAEDWGDNPNAAGAVRHGNLRRGMSSGASGRDRDRGRLASGPSRVSNQSRSAGTPSTRKRYGMSDL